MADRQQHQTLKQLAGQRSAGQCPEGWSQPPAMSCSAPAAPLPALSRSWTLHSDQISQHMEPGCSWHPILATHHESLPSLNPAHQTHRLAYGVWILPGSQVDRTATPPPLGHCTPTRSASIWNLDAPGIPYLQHTTSPSTPEPCPPNASASVWGLGPPGIPG